MGITKTKKGTTEMGRRSSVAQGAKILSTGIAASGMFALTALFGAVERSTASAQPQARAEPQIQTPDPVMVYPQGSTFVPTQQTGITQGQRVTGVSGDLSGQEPAVITDSLPPSAVAATPGAALVTDAVPATTSVSVVVPQPIVVAVPNTTAPQAPPTTASR